MENPENLQYQIHSETSKEAAEKKTDAGADRDRILNLIRSKTNFGLTNDQISEALGKDSSFYSPRLIELERGGNIVKLEEHTRKTRSNRNANIYVATEYRYGRKIIPVKKIGKMPDPMIEEADKKILREFLGSLDYATHHMVSKQSPIYNAIKRLAGV